MEIGVGRQPCPVRSAARVGDQWWVATSDGLWSAPVSAPFLGNPATWTQEAALDALGAVDLTDLVAMSSGELVVLETGWRPTPFGTGLPTERGKRVDGRHGRGVAPTHHGWRTRLGVLAIWPDGMGRRRASGGPVGSGGQCVSAAAWPGHFWPWRVVGQRAFRRTPDRPRVARRSTVRWRRLAPAAMRRSAWTLGTKCCGWPLEARTQPGFRSTGAKGSAAEKGTGWRRIAPPAGVAGADGVQDPMDVSIHPTDAGTGHIRQPGGGPHRDCRAGDRPVLESRQLSFRME